jgi:hypothetical protein
MTIQNRTDRDTLIMLRALSETALRTLIAQGGYLAQRAGMELAKRSGNGSAWRLS